MLRTLVLFALVGLGRETLAQEYATSPPLGIERVAAALDGADAPTQEAVTNMHRHASAAPFADVVDPACFAIQYRDHGDIEAAQTPSSSLPLPSRGRALGAAFGSFPREHWEACVSMDHAETSARRYLHKLNLRRLVSQHLRPVAACVTAVGQLAAVEAAAAAGREQRRVLDTSDAERCLAGEFEGGRFDPEGIRRLQAYRETTRQIMLDGLRPEGERGPPAQMNVATESVAASVAAQSDLRDRLVTYDAYVECAARQMAAEKMDAFESGRALEGNGEVYPAAARECAAAHPWR